MLFQCLAQVPASYISDLRISTDLPYVELLARVSPHPQGMQLRVSVLEKDVQVLEVKGDAENMLKLEVPGELQKWWVGKGGRFGWLYQ